MYDLTPTAIVRDNYFRGILYIRAGKFQDPVDCMRYGCERHLHLCNFSCYRDVLMMGLEDLNLSIFALLVA